MRLVIFLLVAFCSHISHSQIIEVTSFDEIDWNDLGKNQNATFCVIDGRTGALLELRHYKHGKKHGEFLFAGKLLGNKLIYAQSNYKKGTLHGYYHEIGASGYYKNGDKHGTWEYSDDAGNYEKRTYKKGVEHGPYSKKDGLITIEGSYKNGKKDDEWKVYDSNGVVSIIEFYKKGVLEE